VDVKEAFGRGALSLRFAFHISRINTRVKFVSLAINPTGTVSDALLVIIFEVVIVDVEYIVDEATNRMSERFE
tara:strand:+ start:474 stop:692 length:219 start_codon:yes stop_codon:yes gene_type:complete